MANKMTNHFSYKLADFRFYISLSHFTSGSTLCRTALSLWCNEKNAEIGHINDFLKRWRIFVILRGETLSFSGALEKTNIEWAKMHLHEIFQQIAAFSCEQEGFIRFLVLPNMNGVSIVECWRSKKTLFQVGLFHMLITQYDLLWS